MIVSHFRCDWTHPPSEDPVIIFYEVDGRGAVPRLIDVFADGRRARLEAEYGGSLVEGPFRDMAANLLEGHAAEHEGERLTLTPITADMFETEWKIAGGN